MQWWCQIGRQQMGPFGLSDLQSMVRMGQLTRQTFVRLGPAGVWQPASNFPDLFSPSPPPAGVAPLTDQQPTWPAVHATPAPGLSPPPHDPQPLPQTAATQSGGGVGEAVIWAVVAVVALLAIAGVTWIFLVISDDGRHVVAERNRTSATSNTTRPRSAPDVSAIQPEPEDRSEVPAPEGKPVRSEGNSSDKVAPKAEILKNPVSVPDEGAVAGDEHSDNVLGMKLVWCPAGKFLMGSPATDTQEDEKPQVEVELTRGFWLGKYEVTQGEWKELMGREPWKDEEVKEGLEEVKEGADYPATCVTWQDALGFCKKLKERDSASGKLAAGWEYRLPTEAEWEYACRAGSRTRFSFGEDAGELESYAWYGKNAWAVEEKYAHRVGLKKPNGWGLCDMHGNVHEWCGDWYGEKLSGGRDPIGPLTGDDPVNRGGCWGSEAARCRSACRGRTTPSIRLTVLGFRVARVQSKDPLRVARVPSQEPRLQSGSDVFINSLGMRLQRIPAGEFLMGSPVTERDRKDDEKQHRVRIMQPFYLGRHEVTRGEFARFVQAENYRTEGERDGKGAYGTDEAGKTAQKPEWIWRNPSFSQSDDHPVVNVSWNDAQAFCAWLSRKEGKKYRLPTEEEWEYACRAGTTTAYQSGDDAEGLAEIGNVADSALRAHSPGRSWSIASRDGYVHTAPVGRFRANAFGLHDMHGNVCEWCQDWSARYFDPGSPEWDLAALTAASFRACRGGCWALYPWQCRSAFRGIDRPSGRAPNLGFRVALSSPTDLPAAKPPVSVPDEGTKAGDERSDNALGMKFVRCPAKDTHARDEEKPQVEVELTRGFWLGKYEVTQGEWKELMGTEPWKGQEEVKEGADYPATFVSWDDSVSFCKKLTERDSASGKLEAGWEYRLPTEAEWEYACRAGSRTRFSFGEDAGELDKYGWYHDNTKVVEEKYAHRVGLKKPNGWGLCDMHGNVMEWCGEGYGSKLPGGRSRKGPSKLWRGGCWSIVAGGCTSASNGSLLPSRRFNSLGFRVALVTAR